MESINVIVSDTTVESKTGESTIEEEPTNILENDSPEIDGSLPIEIPEVPNWVSKYHPIDNVVGNPGEPVRTRSQLSNYADYACFISLVEPKNVNEEFNDPHWISSIREELIQFTIHDVW